MRGRRVKPSGQETLTELWQSSKFGLKRVHGNGKKETFRPWWSIRCGGKRGGAPRLTFSFLTQVIVTNTVCNRAGMGRRWWVLITAVWGAHGTVLCLLALSQPGCLVRAQFPQPSQGKGVFCHISWISGLTGLASSPCSPLLLSNLFSFSSP